MLAISDVRPTSRLFHDSGLSSVDRRAPGNRRGSGRRGSPRGRSAALATRSATVARLNCRQCHIVVTPVSCDGGRCRGVGAVEPGHGRRQPLARAKQASGPPHQVANCSLSIVAPSSQRARRRRRRRVHRLRDRDAVRLEETRPEALAASRRPHGRRRPGPRAANCWPGGWRHARRCRPFRRRRTDPGTDVRPHSSVSMPPIM